MGAGLANSRLPTGMQRKRAFRPILWPSALEACRCSFGSLPATILCQKQQGHCAPMYKRIDG